MISSLETGGTVDFRSDQSFSWLLSSDFAALSALSPSTKIHHPSAPTVPLSKPPMPLVNSLAKFNVSSSKLPGCSHTAGIPASRASLRMALVMGGCVMTLSEVSWGCGSPDGDATVSEMGSSTVMEERDGV